MGRLLTDTELAVALWDFERTACRLESSRPSRSVRSRWCGWLDGDETRPDWGAWWGPTAAATAAGKRMARVRVVDEPPTDYQRWLRWVSRWNIEAGEQIRYLTRGHAHVAGLLPAAGPDDWWLYDSARLLVLRFDAAGRLVAAEIDTDPECIEQACDWWDLAVHHSIPN